MWNRRQQKSGGGAVEVEEEEEGQEGGGGDWSGGGRKKRRWPHAAAPFTLGEEPDGWRLEDGRARRLMGKEGE
jgi:hypothetical protein